MLAVYGHDSNAWEHEFLGNMRKFAGEALTTRQCETLVEIRDGAERITKVGGFSIASLFKSCFEARYDLGTDEDIDFLERMAKACYGTAMRRRDTRRLLRCARELEIIEGYISLDD